MFKGFLLKMDFSSHEKEIKPRLEKLRMGEMAALVKAEKKANSQSLSQVP